MTQEILVWRKKAAGILKKTLEGEISITQAKELWPCHNKDRLIDVAFHTLGHYEEDSDIRRKDPNYKKWQESDIMELIDKLESQSL